MNSALSLAQRGLGRVFPNPSVGCVIVKNNKLVGRGHTQPGGRPHAETVAIKMAGKLSEGSTAYITLEPCSHIGKTKPCVDQIIKAGIKKVIIAFRDPNPEVCGKGIEKLKKNNIKVVEDVESFYAKYINYGHICRMKLSRPMVTLKLASSLDGKISSQNKKDKWITGKFARNHGHILRSMHDAILVGSKTALEDDPILNVRFPGLEKETKTRVVLDSNLSIKVSSNLVKTAKIYPLVIFTKKFKNNKKFKELTNLGIKIIQVNHNLNKKLELTEIMKALAGIGVTRILLEGGAELASSFLAENLIDQFYLYRSEKIIGSKGLNMFSKISVVDRFKLYKKRELYPDHLEVWLNKDIIL